MMAPEQYADSSLVARVRAQLLAWYQTHGRRLPWRERQDPYGVLVSEFMLQQTRAETVAARYHEFLRRFPTVRALAHAGEEDVLLAWQGLGYYARARSLHQAARQIVSEHGGSVPPDVTDLRRLPGVGRYTAGAIASLAFNRPEPILDANVTRVLARVFAVEGDPRRGSVSRRLWALAAALVPSDDPRTFNSAAMELGALICTSRAPACGRCPLSSDCRAHRQSAVDRFPGRPAPSAVEEVEDVAVFLQRGDAFLLVRRRLGGLWPGMWELPRVRRCADEAREDAARRAARDVCGVRARMRGQVAAVRHRVTRYRVLLTAWDVEWFCGEPQPLRCAETAWTTEAQWERFALSSPQRRLIRAVLAALAQPRLL
jgi:A/G-specific adenine glycosylase